jgi:hypothetical protein
MDESLAAGRAEIRFGFLFGDQPSLGRFDTFHYASDAPLVSVDSDAQIDLRRRWIAAKRGDETEDGIFRLSIERWEHSQVGWRDLVN